MDILSNAQNDQEIYVASVHIIAGIVTPFAWLLSAFKRTCSNGRSKGEEPSSMAEYYEQLFKDIRK